MSLTNTFPTSISKMYWIRQHTQLAEKTDACTPCGNSWPWLSRISIKLWSKNFLTFRIVLHQIAYPLFSSKETARMSQESRASWDRPHFLVFSCSSGVNVDYYFICLYTSRIPVFSQVKGFYLTLLIQMHCYLFFKDLNFRISPCTKLGLEMKFHPLYNAPSEKHL